MNKPFRILLVGCGELGSRHLQAVARLAQVGEIEVVDLRPEALEFGRRRLSEMSDLTPGLRLRWLTDLGEASTGGEVCIVATQAQGRCGQVREVAERLGYTAFLVEKIVAQSIREMEELMELSRLRGLSIWVNLKTRAYPIHQRIKSLLNPTEHFTMQVLGGNWGLANNGIHTADLFAFYDGGLSIENCGGSVDPILHSSKRGGDLFDLSGTLEGLTQKGSRLSLTYLSQSSAPELISIAAAKQRFVIDHFSRWAMQSASENDWAWRPLAFEGNLLVSEMTKGFIMDIASRGRCALPTLEESCVSHRFILGGLRPHFNRLLKKDLELCPVT